MQTDSKLPSVSPGSTLLDGSADRDGNWMDKWGACKVCDGEIPHGHTNNCDIYKLECKIMESRTKEKKARTKPLSLRRLVRRIWCVFTGHEWDDMMIGHPTYRAHCVKCHHDQYSAWPSPWTIPYAVWRLRQWWTSRNSSNNGSWRRDTAVVVRDVNQIVKDQSSSERLLDICARAGLSSVEVVDPMQTISQMQRCNAEPPNAKLTQVADSDHRT